MHVNILCDIWDFFPLKSKMANQCRTPAGMMLLFLFYFMLNIQFYGQFCEWWNQGLLYVINTGRSIHHLQLMFLIPYLDFSALCWRVSNSQHSSRINCWSFLVVLTQNTSMMTLLKLFAENFINFQYSYVFFTSRIVPPCSSILATDFWNAPLLERLQVGGKYITSHSL